MLLAGCAHSRRQPCADLEHAQADPGDAASLATYRQRVERPAAAALVFAAPVAANAPPLDLSRDERQRSAFVGYPEGVVELFAVHWMDRQAGGSSGGSSSWSGSGWGSGYGDRYERCAVSTKVGILNR